MRRRLLVGSLRGPAGPPGRPAPAKAGPAARPPRGRGREPCPLASVSAGSGASRPHAPVAALLRQKGMWGPASLAPLPLWVGGLRSLFGLSGCCRPAAAVPCWARPLRAGPPGPAIAAPAKPSPGRSAAPRLPRSARVRRCRLRGLSLPPLRFGFPSLRCGLPVVALAVLGGALALRVGSPGPPVLAPFGASGPGPPRPGARRLRRRAGGFAPGLFFCARVLRPLRFSSGGGSPLRPSRPRRPRWGLRGSRLPAAWGLRPPLLRSSPGVGVRQAVRPLIVAAAGKGPVWRLRRPCPCRCAFFGARP